MTHCPLAAAGTAARHAGDSVAGCPPASRPFVLGNGSPRVAVAFTREAMKSSGQSVTLTNLT